MQSELQGTKPSAAGDLSVVRTKHHSDRSCCFSKISTVCPRRIVNSLLLQAVKSWMTTVSSHPPESLSLSSVFCEVLDAIEIVSG